MSNATDMVLEPLRQVLKDVSAWFPELETHLLSEFQRLESICATRGAFQVLMSDLPKAGKHLDKCLSRGFIQLGGYPHTLGSLKKGTQLFYKLYSLIFEGCTAGRDLLSDSDVTAVFALRQVLYLYKKLEVDCPTAAVKRSVEEFQVIDEVLYEPSHPWASDVPEDFWNSFVCSRYHFYDLWGHARKWETQENPFRFTATEVKLLRLMDEVREVLGNQVSEYFDPWGLIPKHGPGAVADVRTGEDKYAFPSWPRKLGFYFPDEYFTYSSEEIAYQHGADRSLEIVNARLHAVPKTIDKPRLISIEPTANQFLQQGLLRWFRQTMPDALRRSISFHSQEPSRQMAMEASRNGRFATVDLSSASDRLSCWTVERALQYYGGVLPYLYASRTASIDDGTETVGFTSFPLKKYAGQGNATTFPVQSIVYAMCCYVAVLAQTGLDATAENILLVSRKVRVFGDDLIVPVESLFYLELILGLLQLKVNHEKTHASGGFRESCGMDSFLGADVTPLYLSSVAPGSAPVDLSSWVDVSNNAHLKGLWSLMAWMDKQLKPQVMGLLPVYREPLGCITRSTFCSGTEGLRIKRNNRVLHRPEVKGLIPCSRRRTKARETHSTLLQYFLEHIPFDGTSYHHLEPTRSFQQGYTVKVLPNLRKGWVPYR